MTGLSRGQCRCFEREGLVAGREINVRSTTQIKLVFVLRPGKSQPPDTFLFPDETGP